MNTPKIARYRVRFADGKDDIARIDALRRTCFRPSQDRSDLDQFDAVCEHIMVEDVSCGELVCCYRVQRFQNGEAIEASYAARFFELSNFHKLDFPLIEVGRFCSHPRLSHPDILRLAWAVLTKIVDETRAGLLFGCTSFKGVEGEKYGAAFDLLGKSYSAPEHLKPEVKSQKVVRFDAKIQRDEPNLSRAMKEMPPLLRSYLALGGWVSDHAIIDTDLRTLHVFTGVEIAKIPKSRARLLRADSHRSINMLWPKVNS